MQEKQKELYEQYDMELLHVKRGKGGMICETDSGKYILQTCEYSPKRLEQAFQAKEKLQEQGMEWVDQYIRNKNGSILTYDRYQTPYVMKQYIEGRECDIQNMQEIKKAGETLGELHEQLRKIDCREFVIKENCYEKKTRELNRVRKYILGLNEKREFEILFLKSYPMFETVIGNWVWRESYDKALCHGSFQHHHIIMMNQGGIGVTQFEEIYVGNQMNDVFYLMRKILEKNKYKFSYGKIFIEGYEKCCKLNQQQLEGLYQMLLYPEKFWKLGNQYMNRRKTFLSAKLLEKLQETILLQVEKEKFLKKFWSYYLQEF